MNKKLIPLAVCTAIFVSPVMANEESTPINKFGYNSAELSYSMIEIDSIKLGKAVSVYGSRTIDDSFYAHGGVKILNVDESELPFQSQSSSTSEFNALTAGVGYRVTPVDIDGNRKEDLSLFTELSLTRTSIDIDALHQNDAGISLSGGLRAEMNEYLGLTTKFTISEYNDAGTSTAFSGSFDYFPQENFSVGLSYRFFTIDTPELIASHNKDSDDSVSGSELGINARFHF
ncbi:hypothetical protein [Vibrio harveyi]|uniref:hypothetical protein n=1 Tax=Vibrio harveyi TaxID=669 RepID=UPI003CF37FB1